jgi:hypothetical protein
VLQIEEELRDLAGQQQPLVDDRLGRQAGDVEVARRIAAGLADAVLGELADHVQRPLVRARRHPAHPDVDLAEHRHHRAGLGADVGGVGRDVAPAQDALALGGDRVLEDLLAGGALGAVRRQEHLADAVAAAARHLEAEAQALGLEEAVRELEHDAGAVAGIRIGAAGGAMGQPAQHLEALLDDASRLFAFDMGDEADATGVLLRGRIVEAVPWRRTQSLMHRVYPSGQCGRSAL